MPPFRLCPEQTVPGALGGLVLAGESAPAGTDALWLYEHSDAASTMRLSRSGDDLAFASN